MCTRDFRITPQGESLGNDTLPYFQNIVDEGKEGSDREGAGEQSDEAELDDDLQIFMEEKRPSDGRKFEIFVKLCSILFPVCEDLDNDPLIQQRPFFYTH